jgi:hypothetical protein
MTNVTSGSFDPHARPLLDRLADVAWGPVIAGALAAAALAMVLDSFALAIGLSVSSPAPTWRDASVALVVLSGLYLILSSARRLWAGRSWLGG